MCEIISKSSATQLPRITIGVPVFNGEKFIRTALDSVISQTYSDFVLIISDNASTDSTAQICQEYAERDIRICYLRQESNIGALSNFKFLVNKASSLYFVWLAADDSWEPDFLAENIAALDVDPTAIDSISKVAFNNTGLFLHEAEGTYSLSDSVTQNLWKYLSRPKDNYRFYSVFRTSVIQQSFVDVPQYHAADLFIMAITLLYGKHIETQKLLMHRTIFERERYMLQVDVDNNTVLTRFFPVLPITFYLIRKLRLKLSIFLFLPLLRLNINKHIEYVRLRYGLESYFSFFSPPPQKK